jgi:hypothetical protein
MPCSEHNHEPWPTGGEHTFRIEACERECGWCSAKSTSATNLRSVSSSSFSVLENVESDVTQHAHKHLNNPDATSLHNITIFSGKAGRTRVVARTQSLSKQDQHVECKTKQLEYESKVHALQSDKELLQQQLAHVQSECQVLRDRSSGSGDSNTRYFKFLGKERNSIDDAIEHGSTPKANEVSTDGNEPSRVTHSSRDVRTEISDLVTVITECSLRLRTFKAGLSLHDPVAQMSGVEAFMSWCSVASDSLFALLPTLEGRHVDQNAEPMIGSTRAEVIIDLGGIPKTSIDTDARGATSKARVEGRKDMQHTSESGMSAVNLLDQRIENLRPPAAINQFASDAQLDMPNQLGDSPLQGAEMTRPQQLLPINALLHKQHDDVPHNTLTEFVPHAQLLRYNRTVPSVHYTRTGRISKPKKGLKVHSCECGRSYTRAEHLRRHQKNHAMENALVCEYPDCGKAFYRPDLLLRHQEQHNEGVGPSVPQSSSLQTQSLSNMQSMEESSLKASQGQFTEQNHLTPSAMTAISHQTFSSYWLDLETPTDVLDFFEPGGPEALFDLLPYDAPFISNSHEVPFECNGHGLVFPFYPNDNTLETNR